MSKPTPWYLRSATLVCVSIVGNTMAVLTGGRPWIAWAWIGLLAFWTAIWTWEEYRG